VVELFTSEGCSSCPPADAVLADLVRSGRPVHALAFHVDYWNDLGWPDRFSSADATARQRAYGRALGASGVYTPQAVVGGVDAFVGSDRARLDESLARAGARRPAVTLVVRARAAGPGAVAVDYEAHDAPARAVLDLAVVERAATTQVRAGENAGRTLHHANVVRAFAAVPLDQPAGTATLPLPGGLRGDAGDVIAYVQLPAAPGGGMPIVGSARAALPR
jgi:hypothetical protein